MAKRFANFTKRIVSQSCAVGFDRIGLGMGIGIGIGLWIGLSTGRESCAVGILIRTVDVMCGD